MTTTAAAAAKHSAAAATATATEAATALTACDLCTKWQKQQQNATLTHTHWLAASLTHTQTHDSCMSCAAFCSARSADLIPAVSCFWGWHCPSSLHPPQART